LARSARRNAECLSVLVGMRHQATRALDASGSLLAPHDGVRSSPRIASTGARGAGGLGVGRDMDITGSERRPLRAPQPACNACIGVAMKQFLITLLAVGVLASAAQAEARLMSTRGQCVDACGQAVSESCGWITKRGKFNRCRTKLINQCKRFGTNVMCPAPQPPPTSPTAPTTPTTLPTAILPPPVVTTTTTVPRPTLPPTTTTTLPAIPDVRGNYSFDGYVTNDTCGISNGIGSSVTFNFSVTTQVG